MCHLNVLVVLKGYELLNSGNAVIQGLMSCLYSLPTTLFSPLEVGVIASGNLEGKLADI